MTTTIDRLRTELKVTPGLFIPEIENDLTRREFLIGTGLIVIASGCGSDGGGVGESAGQSIAHELGETTVPENPEQIVTLSPAETEISLALGLKPGLALRGVRAPGLGRPPSRPRVPARATPPATRR